MPRLSALMLARYAEVTSGRVNMIGGGLHLITVPSLPAEHPSLSVVAEIIDEGDKDEDSRHSFEIRLLTPGGQIIGSQAEDDVVLPAGRGYGRSLMIVVEATELVLEEEGLHRVVLIFDGEVVGECPFAVRVRPASTEAT